MNNDVFNRVLKLALRTGDKVIIVDPSQPKPYVMMDLEDYESLISKPDKFSPENEIKENFKSSNLMSIRGSGIGDQLKSSIGEPGVESALSGSDPLEPDSASPSQVEKMKLSSSDNGLETEEHFYLEPIED